MFASIRFLDQEVVSKLAEMDMIVADLERANSRVATVERRNVWHFNVLRSIPISIRGCRSYYALKSSPFGVGTIRAIGVFFHMQFEFSWSHPYCTI
jgi:hypothetical protein